MDNIWDRNPSKSEVIGRSGWDEKTRMTMQNRQKSNAKKTQNVKKNLLIHFFISWRVIYSHANCYKVKSQGS